MKFLSEILVKKKSFGYQETGGSEFQSRGPMTEKANLPSDDRTYEMERTSEFEDRISINISNIFKLSLLKSLQCNG